MNRPKIQPRLANEIVKIKEGKGSRFGLRPAEVESKERRKKKITVNIVHKENLKVDTKEITKKDPTKILRQLDSKFEEVQAPVKDKLRNIADVGEPKKSVLSNSIVIDLTPSQIESMSEIEQVKVITLETLDMVTCLDESVDIIDVPHVWRDLGKTGKGIRVAVIDTGVDKNHPDLRDKVVDEVNLTSDRPGVPPDYHGTHVAGIIASNDPLYRGVAYDTEIINVKVMTSGGFGSPYWVVDGIEQAVRREANILSMSLGWSQIQHWWVCYDADCVLCRAADTAVDIGCHVIVAAGNYGNANKMLWGPARRLSNITCPGNARNVITVAAVDKTKRPWYLSSRGPGTAKLSSGSRLIKPDISGPGVAIVSTILDGQYAPVSGTSMATPHVSGTVALLLEQDPIQSPQQVKNLLKKTTKRIRFSKNEVGSGIVNAYKALSQV
jgi:serine protease AprX